MSFKAFIFDMDGVMLDSEPLHVEAYNAALAAFNVNVSMPEFKLKYLGLRGRDVSQKIAEDLHLPITGEELHKRKGEFYTDFILHRELPITQGLLKAVQEMHTLVPLAVASNSNPKSIEIITERLGLREYFSLYVSGSNVPNGKPAPDIYIETAKLLKVLPEDCMVLEDSPPGIQAAKSAGMKCIGITTSHYAPEEIQTADAVIDSLDRLVETAKKL